MNSQAGSDQLVEEMLSHLKPPMPVVDHEDDSQVAAFYANRTVFITGATGFIGKALIEKLIRSCPRLKRIYILVREKRGKCVDERLTDLIKAQCFDRIRQAHNGSSHVLAEKLRAIRGDITHPKFGISPEDMRMLSDECTIVINSAATIRFSEPIDIAVRNNIYSVGQLVEFCNELAHLQALIHLSTAYSNCHKRDTIDEIFYEPPMRGDQIQENIKNMQDIQAKIHVYPELTSAGANPSDKTENGKDESHRDACKSQCFYYDEAKFVASSQAANNASGATGAGGNNGKRGGAITGPAYDLLDEFTQIALRRSNRPNTYTFTKAISETYLLDKTRARSDRYLNDKIPVAVVRPSIVSGAWREPMVGFVDNYNGPTGVILALYTGALQAMPGDGDFVADMVPIDMVTNMVLCAGWYLVEQSATREASASEPTASSALKIKQDQGVYVFNFVSGMRNPLRWHQVTEAIAELAYKYPSKFLIRLPGSYFVRSGNVYDWYDLFYQKLPAYIMDLVKSKLCLKRIDERSSSVTGYRRIKQMTDTLTPFTSHEWRLSDANTQALYERLDPIDKRVFPFDVASIDWYEYIRAFIIGSRIYLLRDAARNVPAAKGQLRRRRALNWIGIGSLIVLIYCMFIL